jgi:hypothetical protein
MKNNQIVLIIIGFILLALMATNPSIEDHREGVKEMYKKKLGEMNKDKKDDLATQIGTGIGMLIGDGFIDKIVSRDNYLLFSLTKVSVGDKTNNIGIGILGQVFIQDYEKIQSEIGGDGLINESETITNQISPKDTDLTPRLNPSNNNPYMWFDLKPGTYSSNNCNSNTIYEWNRNEPGNGMAQMSLTETNNSTTVAEFSTAMDNYQIIDGGLILGDSKKLIIISNNSFITSDGCIWARD